MIPVDFLKITCGNYLLPSFKIVGQGRKISSSINLSIPAQYLLSNRQNARYSREDNNKVNAWHLPSRNSQSSCIDQG